MDYVTLGTVSWARPDELNVSIGTDHRLPSGEHADVVYGRLGPQQTLKLHRHMRNNGGYEAFFFFRGASIRVTLNGDEVREIHSIEPFHLTFHDDEAHSVANLTDDPLIFEIICAPRHVAGEESVS